MSVFCLSANPPYVLHPNDGLPPDGVPSPPKPRSLALAVALLLGLLSSGCANQAWDLSSEDSDATARVRVVHLGPDAPPVDVYIGTAAALTGLAFTEGSAAGEVPAGRVDFAVTAAAAPLSTAVATLGEVLLEEDRDYTIFAFGELSGLQLNTIEDDRQGLSSDHVRIRVVHAAAGVGNVDVYELPPGGAPVPLAENLRYGSLADPVDLPAVASVIGIDVDADGRSDLRFNVPALAPGTIANVFAVADGAEVFLLAQLDGSTTVRIDGSTTQLRVLHLSPDSPSVETFVDGTIPGDYQDIEFTESTAYTKLATGSHDLDVSADGTVAGAVISIGGLALDKDTRYTAVAIDTLDNISAILFEDTATGLSSGQIRVRAIHAAPGIGQVDLLNVGANGSLTPLVSNLDFGEFSNPLDLDAGAYTIGVDVDNDANPEVYFELPALSAGTLANIYVTQDAAGDIFALAQLDGATTAVVSLATSEIRLLHLSPDAPSVDAYANGGLIVSDLAYSESTDTITVPSGSYDLDVTVAGSPIGQAVIQVSDASFLPSRAYTIFAYGNINPPAQFPDRGLTAGIIEDDEEGLNAATDIRLQVIHVATIVTRGDVFSVAPEGNTLLIQDIGFGETEVTPDLPSSAYTVGFDAEANGVIDIDFDLPVLAPGNYANVFVAVDPTDEVYLLVQTMGAGTIRVDAN
jgi:hypothetical protein